jgi:hypothetical protein
MRLALSYDVPFNQEALQRHLIAQKELGGWMPDQRFAAFLIAYHSRDSRKLIDFFEQHRDDLFGQTDLDRSALAGLETELLARAGRFDEARAHLALHRGTHLSHCRPHRSESWKFPRNPGKSMSDRSGRDDGALG